MERVIVSVTFPMEFGRLCIAAGSGEQSLGERSSSVEMNEDDVLIIGCLIANRESRAWRQPPFAN